MAGKADIGMESLAAVILIGGVCYSEVMLQADSLYGMERGFLGFMITNFSAKSFVRAKNMLTICIQCQGQSFF